MRPGISFEKVWNVITDAPVTLIETSAVPPECRIPGVKLDYLKGWLKLESKNGNRVYIARQVLVRQIDTSGFGAGMAGTLPLERKNGAVEAHLDLSDEKAALARLEELLLAMPTIEPTKKTVVRPAGASSPKPQKVDPKASSLASLDAVAAQERLNRILAYAASKGQEVSMESVASLIALGATLPETNNA